MRCLSAAAMLALWSAFPANAAGSIECTSGDGEASIKLTVGSLPVLAVVDATMDANGRNWATSGEGSEDIAVGQAFRENGEMRVDFTDTNVERVLAKLRLFFANEGRDLAMAGILKIAGAGVWAVSCTGP